jgi:hypothetical protein
MFLILLLISKYLSVPKLEYVYLVNPETKLIRGTLSNISRLPAKHMVLRLL